MKTRLNLIPADWSIVVFVTCCLIVMSVAVNFRLPDGILNDPFHQGEYFSALVTLLADQPGLTPLTIHGALDYIPGLAAMHLFGQSAYFFPTWLIYRLLDFIAAAIFLALAFKFTKNRPKKLLVVLATALVVPSLVGYRDVAILLSIYLYFFIQQKKHPVNNLLFEACFGLSVAFGLFWSFDRGIAAAVSLGAACIIHSYKNRLYLVSLFAFFITLLFLGHISPQFSLDNYFVNFKVLAETSSQWSYVWSKGTLFLTSFLGFINIIAILFLGSLMINSKASSAHIANSTFLILLSLFLFKVGSNRADMQHILMGLWGPLLAALYWYSNGENIKLNLIQKIALIILYAIIIVIIYKFKTFALIPLAVIIAIGLIPIDYLDPRPLMLCKLLIATLALPLLFAVYSMSRGISNGQYNWIHYLRSPPPNLKLVTSGVRWASQELINSGSNCVFDLSNNGVINGLTNLPACSQFVYPVYANQHYENDLIDSLKTRRPKAIVYSSTFWSYNIDNKPMKTRFPNLDKYILKEYKFEKCSFGYCIRYLGVAR